ncbi:MAG: helix-turn-helix transcriptional regulator [Eubacteriales bacterium]|nr:helix-turn-helix transcriptional regulator [Eubacteriales bacterium]
MATFGERLKEALRLRDMTQAQISRHLQVSTATVTGWVRGKYCAKYENIIAIADLLNVNPEWLGGEDVPMYKTEVPTIDVSEIEKRILSLTHVMNNDGKEQVYRYAEDLSGNPRYRADVIEEDPFTLAAHRKDGGNVTSDDALIAIHDIIEAARKKKDNKAD